MTLKTGKTYRQLGEEVGQLVDDKNKAYYRSRTNFTKLEYIFKQLVNFC